VSIISRMNRVTLPVNALRAAGLEPGDDLRVQALGPGRLELARADDIVEEFAGISMRPSIPTAISTSSAANRR